MSLSCPKSVSRKDTMDAKLSEELARLKRVFDAGHDLKSVKWLPGGSAKKEDVVEKMMLVLNALDVTEGHRTTNSVVKTNGMPSY